MSPTYVGSVIATNASAMPLPSLAIFSTAALKSTLFPIVHHLGSVATGPRAKRVLSVGLSGGAWIRALEGFPEIEAIDVIEINPAYTDLAAH